MLQHQQLRLQMTMSSLQLAFAAVSASTLPAAFATSPFEYVPAAFEVAHSQLQQLERFLRALTLADAELWQRASSRRLDRPRTRSRISETHAWHYIMAPRP